MARWKEYFEDMLNTTQDNAGNEIDWKNNEYTENTSNICRSRRNQNRCGKEDEREEITRDGNELGQKRSNSISEIV